MSERNSNALPIVIEQPPWRCTALGDFDEENAALYISYRRGKATSARTLRRWRRLKQGPVYHRVGRQVWYRGADLDEFIEITSCIDPLAA